MQSKKGFTLAEVLIALALLGIIAAFTIPKVLQSTENESRTALLKETLAIMSGIVNEGWSKGEVSPVNFTLYFQNRLNALKTCTISNNPSQSCWVNHGQAVDAEGGSPGFILPSGVAVVGIESDPVGYCTLGSTTCFQNGFAIDYNGVAPPNKLGEDTLWLSVCFGKDSCIDGRRCGGGVADNQKPGTIVPFRGSPSTCGSDEMNANEALFQSLYQ